MSVPAGHDVEDGTNAIDKPSTPLDSASEEIDAAASPKEQVTREQGLQRSPYLEIKVIEQPKQRGYRFCDRDESLFHGGLLGETSEDLHKVYPTVQLGNFSGRAARVVVQLVCVDDPVRPHANYLVGDNVASGQCTVEMSADTNWTATFPNLDIVQVTESRASHVLLERYALVLTWPEPGTLAALNPEPGEELAGGASAVAALPTEDVANLMRLANEQTRTMNLSGVRLCFQAFLEDDNGQFKNALPPCISHPVYSMLSIYKMNLHSGSAIGGDEVYLLCNQVQRDDVTITFFDDSKQSDWEADGIFSPSDVHQQVAIVFKTPPYWNTSIDHPVNVWVALKRKSDGEISKPEPFTYHPRQDDEEEARGKRRKSIPPEFAGNPLRDGKAESDSDDTDEQDWRSITLMDSTYTKALFRKLSEFSSPFNRHWRDILRHLPEVPPAVDRKGKAKRRYAFPRADNEIKSILESVQTDLTKIIDSACLWRVLTRWRERSVGDMAVAHLLDVFRDVGLSRYSKGFFSELFTNQSVTAETFSSLSACESTNW